MRTRLSVVALHSPLAVLALTTTVAAQGATEMISVSSGGTPASSYCFGSYPSRDGRYVAFWSYATNLVPSDTNGASDVFVRDRAAATTERVSVGLGGAESNGFSQGGPISADGRFVAFKSWADNLVAGDTNHVADIFVFDRATSTTTRVSVDSYGNEGNGESGLASLSADGRFVAFASSSTNLVGLGDVNGSTTDVFVHDMTTGATEAATLTPGGAMGATGGVFFTSLSDDGRYVAFVCADGNLVPNDNNGMYDVFVRDMQLGVTEIVSRAPGGAQSNGTSLSCEISGDGRFVAFRSSATNLVAGDTNDLDDIFVRDRSLGTTVRANVGQSNVQEDDGGITGGSSGPSLSSDGSLVCFDSSAINFVPDDTSFFSDVYVRDLGHATTVRMSVDSQGAGGSSAGSNAHISGDGSLAVFEADLHAFGPPGPGSYSEIYARRVGASLPRTYCTAKTNSLGCAPTISFHGYASANLATTFVVTANQVISHTNGLFFYGLAPSATPFQGGTLCVHSPTVRTALQSSGGNAGSSDCSGAYALDLGARIHAGSAVGLTVGVRAFGQFWMRDPASPSTTGLSDALDFSVLP